MKLPVPAYACVTARSPDLSLQLPFRYSAVVSSLDVTGNVTVHESSINPADRTSQVTGTKNPDEQQTAFGKWLSKTIKAKGLTQSKLASELGISKQAVSEWITKGTSPGGDKLFPLAAALDVSPEDLTSRLSGQSRSSVDRQTIENAAIVFTNDDTGEVWATVEFTFKVRVHNPVKISGAQRSRVIDVDAEGNLERDEPTR